MAGFPHEGGRQAKICGWGAEGICLRRDVQHFLQHWRLFFQDQHCSSNHSYLQQPGTPDTVVFHENFRRCLQVHSALRDRVTFPLHSPWSSPSSPPLPLEHIAEENIRFQALQTSSLNQHPVKLRVKGRNTSLPNHKGCNECGLIGWYKSCAARISSWQ